MRASTGLPHLLKIKGLRPVDLARLLKVNKATVSRWAKKQIPVDRVSEVSRVTGIPETALRPDLATMFHPDRKAS